MTAMRRNRLLLVTAIGAAIISVGLTVKHDGQPEQTEREAGRRAPPVRGGAADINGHDVAPQVYGPQVEDFRPEYDRDEVNRKVQTWDQYWGWIRDFYDGNLLSSGWKQETRSSIGVVSDPIAHRDLLESMNGLGRDVAREWAKDNGVRRISTDDLRRWGSRLRAARRADDGTGRSLIAIVKMMRSEAARLLSKDPTSLPKSRDGAVL